MEKTMFEVNWHYTDDSNGTANFSHCTVTPIRVVREGFLLGCTGISITAIDCDGRKVQGSPENYHDTESDAWGEVRETLENMVCENETTLAKLTARNAEARKYLENIRGEKRKNGESA